MDNLRLVTSLVAQNKAYAVGPGFVLAKAAEVSIAELPPGVRPVQYPILDGLKLDRMDFPIWPPTPKVLLLLTERVTPL
jgi:hypothetical protein